MKFGYNKAEIRSVSVSTTSPSGWYDVLTRASRATVLPVVQEATTPPKTRATLAEKNEELIGKVQNEIAKLLLQSATDDALSGVSKKFNDDLAKLVMKTEKVHEEHARNQKGFQGGWGRSWRMPIRSSSTR